MATITDDFNRTAETPLSNGGVWSVGVGSYDNINTDGAQAQAAVEDSQFCVARADSPSIGNDQYAEIVLTIASNSGGGGPCVRQQASTDQAMYGVQIFIDGTHWSSARRLLIFDAGGAETTLATTSDTASSGDTIRLEMSGTTLTAKKNGAGFSPALTATNAVIASGQPGFMLACNSATLSNVEADNFSGGDFVAGRTTKNTRAWPLGMEIGMNRLGQI